jgi:phospholipid/cholesterol/gamma-HCH transport system substrate-binding protein
MRRLAVISAVVVALTAALATGALAGDGDTDGYEVRALFDNGAFLVPGEEVRIAGATVGTVADVDVSGTDEAVHSDGTPEPGKAVVVLHIDDEGFQDFRTDASCLIRPQSLIGEKYVECQATQPRAAGSAVPPPLEPIADGEPGEGQYFLPLEQNGKAVDLDLVNNIMREPYPDRFRLILNDLGAGLAARGEDLAEVVERANPALRETNEVLAILARQSRQLADLARDGDRVLAPLARERESISGFINEAETVAAASAERAGDIEAGFERLPGALRELRPTMTELRRFADEATPVFSDLRAAAPSLNRATRALGPFSSEATGALTTLGDAAVAAEDPLIASDPVIVDIRKLAKSGKPVATNLAKLLRSLRATDGFEFLTQFIYFTAGSINAFDSYGHFLRAVLPTNNCVDYEQIPEPGCDSNFNRPTTAAAPAAAGAGGKRARDRGTAGVFESLDAATEAGAVIPQDGAAPSAARFREAQALLDFLVGEPRQTGTDDGRDETTAGASP